MVKMTTEPGEAIRPQRVKFVTLGCKVNQYETQGMREAFERRGVFEAQGGQSVCDWVVINTCTVTRQADRENRYWIRRVRREYPGAKVIVTGCYVEKNHSELQSLPGIDALFSNRQKPQIADYAVAGKNSGVFYDRETFTPSGNGCLSLRVSRFTGKGRAFVKIQDGCHHACSYCKVVLVRGKPESRPLAEIVDEVTRLRDAGYQEIVLAGVQLGAYGLDLSPALRLVQVIEACGMIEGIRRIRLSSLEPQDLSEDLFRILRDMPQCCPHLHMPLQSGDDEVLSKMNRGYRTAFYRDWVLRLKRDIPDFNLTLDVIAGFPGETDRAFQNTCDLLTEIRPLKCHVFPYSRREGTRAAAWQDLSPSLVRARVKELLGLEAQLGAEIRRGYLGRVFSVLPEKTTKEGAEGYTPNYLKVDIKDKKDLAGDSVRVRLESLRGDRFQGRLVS